MAEGLGRAARLARHDEQGSVQLELARDALDGRRVGRVEDDELERAVRGPERAHEDLGREARTSHPEQDRGLELVGRLLREGLELADPVVHQVGDREPAETVGDLGRVVLPDRVILAPDPLDDPVAVQLLEAFGHVVSSRDP